MCLYANKPTTKILKNLPLTGKLTVWKVFTISQDYINFKTCMRLKSLSLTGRYRTQYKYTPGEHGAPDAAIDSYGQVHAGIHVCLTLKEAQCVLGTYLDDSARQIIQLEVDLKDLVAIGHFSDFHKIDHDDQEAVFSKITLTKEVYDDAIAKATAALRHKRPEVFAGCRKHR